MTSLKEEDGRLDDHRIPLISEHYLSIFQRFDFPEDNENFPMIETNDIYTEINSFLRSIIIETSFKISSNNYKKIFIIRRISYMSSTIYTLCTS